LKVPKLHKNKICISKPLIFSLIGFLKITEVLIVEREVYPNLKVFGESIKTLILLSREFPPSVLAKI